MQIRLVLISERKEIPIMSTLKENFVLAKDIIITIIVRTDVIIWVK